MKFVFFRELVHIRLEKQKLSFVEKATGSIDLL